MAIFAEVNENECIIERHLRDIESQSPFNQNGPFSTMVLRTSTYDRAMSDARSLSAVAELPTHQKRHNRRRRVE